MKALLDSSEAAGDRHAPLWRLLVDTDCRIGEALALTWGDVDLDRQKLAIRRTLVKVERDGTPTTGDPKTPRSVRRVTLAPDTVAALRAHRARQLEERLACGPAHADHGLIFASPIGTGTRTTAVLRPFRAALRRAELPATLRTHDLRHTVATLMLQAGVNSRVAADRLGHASVVMTLTVYAHVTESMEADAADRVTRLMAGNG